MRLLGPKSNSQKEERRRRVNRPSLKMWRARTMVTKNKNFWHWSYKKLTWNRKTWEKVILKISKISTTTDTTTWKDQTNICHSIITKLTTECFNMVEWIMEQNNSKCTKIETAKEAKISSLEIPLRQSSFRIATWTCNSHCKFIINISLTIIMAIIIHNNMAWEVWMIYTIHIKLSRSITQLQIMRWSTQTQTAWITLSNLIHSHPTERY